MKLIIGGAYQGKLDFAKDHFGIKDDEVFTCDGWEIDFSRRCICGFEKFTLASIRENVDPETYMREHREQWEHSIIICRDIFCGVVPVEEETRQWRQITGRVIQYLSQEAEQVSRIFCGLEQRLK